METYSILTLPSEHCQGLEVFVFSFFHLISCCFIHSLIALRGFFYPLSYFLGDYYPCSLLPCCQGRKKPRRFLSHTFPRVASECWFSQATLKPQTQILLCSPHTQTGWNLVEILHINLCEFRGKQNVVCTWLFI